MTTTARGTARVRYETNAARHSQRGTAVAPEAAAAPMGVPSTPWGRVAQAAEEAGWTGQKTRCADGRRIVAMQRGAATLTVVWGTDGDVLSQSWAASAPDYTKRTIRSEREALEALRR